MKKYKKSDDLIKDLKEALAERPLNNFTRITYGLLDNPKLLINEYKSKPGLKLVAKNGDWMYVWENIPIKIDDEYVLYSELFKKLEELLQSENKL